MIPGGIHNETGRQTAEELQRLKKELSELKRLLSTVIRNGQVIASHDTLSKLGYADSGHTGFASTTSLTAHTGNTSNPHSVTAAQVGAITVYRQDAEPSSPGEFTIWIKTAAGQGDQLCVSLRKSDDSTWAYYPIVKAN